MGKGFFSDEVKGVWGLNIKRRKGFYDEVKGVWGLNIKRRNGFLIFHGGGEQNGFCFVCVRGGFCETWLGR